MSQTLLRQFAFHEITGTLGELVLRLRRLIRSIVRGRNAQEETIHLSGDIHACLAVAQQRDKLIHM